MSQEYIKLKYQEINELYKKKYAEGCNLSNVKKLVDNAMRYYETGDYGNAEKFLDMANLELKEAKPSQGGITNIFVPIVILILIVGIGIFAWNSFQNKGENETEYKTYENSEYGFSIKYPKDWIKNEKLLPASPGYVETLSVEFRHPTEDVSLAIGIIKTGTIQRQISLEEGAERAGKYWESAIEQGGGKVISTRSLTINGISMYEIIYTTPIVVTIDDKLLSGSFKVKYLDLNTENNVGLLMYYAPLDTYPKYEAIIDKSIQSIKLK